VEKYYRYLKRQIHDKYHSMTASSRPLPDFLIIGAPRSGTTSLYHYLMSHPDISPPLKKEIGYFSLRYQKGEQWYRHHFPVKKKNELTGEASPGYIYHPEAAKRIREVVPDAKIVAVLRDPVDRCYSGFWQQCVRDRSVISRYDVSKFRRIITSYFDTLDDDCLYASNKYDSLNHITRGCYVSYLEPYYNLFGYDNMCVVCTEDLRNDPMSVLSRIAKFLGVSSDWYVDVNCMYNRHVNQPYLYDGKNDEVIDRLRKFYEPFNHKLYRMIGQTFTWNKE